MRQNHGDSPRKQVYLDNAATSHPKPDAVYAQTERFLRDIGASSGRGGYSLALEADREMFRVRELAARFIGVGDSSRIIFTFNATHGLNLVLKGLLHPGDEVVTTSMEHNSVMRPLHALQRQGIMLRIVWVSEQGILSIDNLRKAITSKTRLIVVNHVSNVVGSIQPIEEIAQIARENRALFLVDAAQSLGHLPVHVEQSGIDILAGSGHKGLLGPPGTGILYVSPEVVLQSVMEGGTGSRSESSLQPAIYPDFLESGTQNIPGIAGMGAGIEFLMETGMQKIRDQNVSQAVHLLDGLSKIPRIRQYGPADGEQVLPVVSFTIDNMDPADVAMILDDVYGIMVRAGLHCSPHAHQTIKSYPAGTVRVSPGHFTTSGDLDYFLESVAEISGAG